jgi:hypothetical protein
MLLDFVNRVVNGSKLNKSDKYYLYSSLRGTGYYKLNRKDPLPVGKGIVKEILTTGGYYTGYCGIWNALGREGYDVRVLKRYRAHRKLSMEQFMGIFPRPVLESIYINLVKHKRRFN